MTMKLDDALKRVAVLGAAGKMGSGISLLMLQEMACLEARQTGNIGSGLYKLVLIDANIPSLDGLRRYLHAQIVKYAEKNINVLRSLFADNRDIVSNEEMIYVFTQGAMDIVHYHQHSDAAKGAHLIFEAIVEDVDVKCKVLGAIAAEGGTPPYFFSNTSSIPIHILNERGNLHNRIIGFHFYNPPAVQRLLEIISSEQTDSILRDYADDIAKRLQKTVVHSHDVAGFIGNGQFIREIVYACQKVEELAKTQMLPGAIYLVDKVSRDFLIRPMGIFQLLDYVGLDVAQRIAKIMSTYLQEEFRIPLIDQMVAAKRVGGQHPDGSQKNGFFEYSDHAPSGIYRFDSEKYAPLSNDSWAQKYDALLGLPPSGWLSWKKMQQAADKNEKLKLYLQQLFQEDTMGARMARAHLNRAREIARKLVEDGVAGKIDDVNTVMEKGFFHLYGPDSPLIPQEETTRRLS